MDVLDRLTDKASLEKAYEARGRKLVTIDAAALADKLKSRVIGQDAAIESMAAQLRRRLAAQRPDKPVAVFCLAGPPGMSCLGREGWGNGGYGDCGCNGGRFGSYPCGNGGGCAARAGWDVESVRSSENSRGSVISRLRRRSASPS